MIRLTGMLGDGRKFLILGVDKENIRRLTNGHPIRCTAESVNIDRDVMIIYGDTLQDVADELSKAGLDLAIDQKAQA